MRSSGSCARFCSAHAAAVDLHELVRTQALDLGVVADGAQHGVLLGDERVIEKIKVGARRGADLHHVFEKEKLFARERPLGHAQPRIAR